MPQEEGTMRHTYAKSNLFIAITDCNEYGSAFAHRTVVFHARCIGTRHGYAIFRMLGDRVRSSSCSSGGFDHQIGFDTVVGAFGKTVAGQQYFFLPVEETLDGVPVPEGYENTLFRWWTEPFGRLKKPA